MIIMMALTIIIIIVIIIAAKVALFSVLVNFSPDSADQFAHKIELKGLLRWAAPGTGEMF